MKAMLLHRITTLPSDSSPLSLEEIPTPKPGPGEILIRITRCGVCHTELDEIEGRTPPPRFPVVPGHQVVGRVAALGANVRRFSCGDRVGVAWIYSACGHCRYCQSGQENLCPEFRATGRDVHGGYAEYMVAREDFAYPIPEVFSDSEAAPLLCAGAIGYRSLRLANLREGARLGLTGFGASGHLVLKMVKHSHPGVPVYVFARSEQERQFALQLGAEWAGDPRESSPELLDAIIDTTPVWTPVVEALRNLAPGGRLVINAIRKEDLDRDVLATVDYPRHLWLEKEIKSVANVTRKDVSEFLALAAEVPLRPEYQEYPLEEANRALLELKERKIRGAKVLVICD
ncbi:MAG: zinc-dependent alcohol dehydrogenase family protein [candidate division KSB1 bacterium]|nr:zinc-dependent alcohol dehydrogenase family protein [candidate division KSB1 bacterium]